MSYSGASCCLLVIKASEDVSAKRVLEPSDLSFLFPLMLIKMGICRLLLYPAECMCFLAPSKVLAADTVCFGSRASLGCRILRLAGTQTPSSSWNLDCLVEC